MFSGTLDNLSTRTAEALKPYAEAITTALHIIAGIAVMILLALITKLCQSSGNRNPLSEQPPYGKPTQDTSR